MNTALTYAYMCVYDVYIDVFTQLAYVCPPVCATLVATDVRRENTED